MLNSLILEGTAVPAKNFTVTETLLYAAVGFLLTLAVLALMWGIIALMTLIFKKLPEDNWFGRVFKIKKKKKVASSEIAEPTAPGSSGEIKTFGVPDKEVAMIMAIVADELQTPLNELKFISIKEINEENGL